MVDLLEPRPPIALLFLATLGTGAQWGWQEGVARLAAARAGLFLYLKPCATTVLAVPLLGEAFWGGDGYARPDDPGRRAVGREGAGA